MSLQEEKNRTGNKPVAFTIAIFFFLLILSLLFQDSVRPFVYFLTNFYLFPFHLEIPKLFTAFIATLISCGIALLAFIFLAIAKTKFRFYLVGTIVTYFIYLGAWYCLKFMWFVAQDMGTIEGFVRGIIYLLLSLIFMVLILGMHYTLMLAVYEYEFLKETEAYQSKNGLESKKLDNITLISDQEIIKALYERLERAEQYIHNNLTSDAATNLRIVGENLIKQISIHNKLALEKMEFYKLVNSLYENDYISKDLKDLLSMIRKLGNKAAHELGTEEELNKNGLLKLHRQLLVHLDAWVINDQKEIVDSVKSEINGGYKYSNDAYKIQDEFEKNDGKEIEELNIDEDEEIDELDDDDYDGEEIEEFEEGRKTKRFAAFTLLPKEKREMMKF